MCFIGEKYSIFYYCQRKHQTQKTKTNFQEHKSGQAVMSRLVLFNGSPTG